MNVKIYVCCHQKGFYANQEGYVPIQVGKRVSNIDLGFDADDEGDNISDKNPWYCELTAQYWIWKNCNDADYVGLCHYRRYFDFNPSFFDNIRHYKFVNEEYLSNHIKVDEDFLASADVITVSKQSFNVPSYDVLCRGHIRKDVRELENVVAELYPEYLDDYKYVIYEENHYYPFNMMIAKREIYNDYSKWLFDILFEFEKRLCIPADPYQPRVFGFYSERLLYVYLHHHPEYKIKQLPVLQLTNNKNQPLVLLKAREWLRNLTCFLYKKTN